MIYDAQTVPLGVCQKSPKKELFMNLKKKIIALFGAYILVKKLYKVNSIYRNKRMM